MASAASLASTSLASTAQQPGEQETNGSLSQPQAGPLPCKRGELGFQDDIPAVAPVQAVTATLPARHPAEPPDQPLYNDSLPSRAASDHASRLPVDTTSMHTTGKRSVFLRASKRVWGLSLTTLLRCLLQVAIMGGIIAGWALLVSAMAKKAAKRRATEGTNPSSFDSVIFIHVAFAIATLGQLVFLERVIFLLRAQRYCHLHPGTELPTALRRRGGRTPEGTNAAIAFAPWNRPPLPTYAAALAESGYGTGDVEDNQIAAPPPPAYGQTRGSKMLLTGFMSDTLRKQARAARDSVGSLESVVSDHPACYMSHDSAWDERVDAGRAVQLEETLARLEDPERRVSTTGQSA